LGIKIKILGLFFGVLLNSISAQDGPPRGPDSDGVYTVVQQSAEFPGGIPELHKFVNANLVWPASVVESNIKGTVFLKFIISANGIVRNIEILKGIQGCPECDKEAVRVAGIMPNWKPAQQDGNKVDCYFVLPVKFAPNK